MQLSEPELSHVWDDLLAAEVRALYFADLASWYTKQKQIITGVSFFLSSGAAATPAAKIPTWIPLVFSIFTAVLTAYSIAVGIDRKAASIAKLHSTWNRIAADYKRLWDHWYEDDATETLKDILIRSREASEVASTDAPYEESRVDKWRKFAYQQYGVAAA